MARPARPVWLEIEGAEQVRAARASLRIGDNGAFALEPIFFKLLRARKSIIGIGGALLDDGLEQPAQRLALPVVSQDQLDGGTVLKLGFDRELHSLIRR